VNQTVEAMIMTDLKNDANEYSEMNEVCATLKEIAKKHNLSIITVAQNNDNLVFDGKLKTGTYRKKDLQLLYDMLNPVKDLPDAERTQAQSLLSSCIYYNCLDSRGSTFSTKRWKFGDDGFSQECSLKLTGTLEEILQCRYALMLSPEEHVVVNTILAWRYKLGR